jgi:hypothetical protein
VDFEPIQVMRSSPKGSRGPFPGIRLGRVACYEFPMFDMPVRAGWLPRDRSYLLLDEGIQMACPPGGLPDEQDGWWYVDLVEITEDGAEIEVMDHYLDVIVGPPEHYYRVLDMDEFGDALAEGKLSATQAITGLRNFQRFFDRYFNRRHDITLGWPDFPPQAIRPLTTWKSDLYPEGAPATFWD